MPVRRIGRPGPPRRLPVDGFELPVGVGRVGNVNRRRTGSDERHFDGQPSPWPGFGDDGGIMSGGNGFYDGETEAVPLALAETGTIEPLEGLEEPLDVAGIDNGAGVGERQVSRAVPGAVFTRAEPPGMLWRKALCTRLATSLSTRRGFARRGCGLDVMFEAYAKPSGLGPSRVDHQFRDGRKVDRVGGFQPLLAGGQGEESFDKPFLRLAVQEQFLTCGTQTGSGGARVGEGELKKGAFQGDPGAQPMGRVGDEPALRFERSLEPAE